MDTSLAYARGVQRVELASRARDTAGLNFYLLEFEQACNRTKQGCSAGDLFTPRIETDWLRVRVRDDEDLKNTEFDCRQCHQRARDTSTLLMRERENPWTHFFYSVDDLPGINGSELEQDYLSAKGGEAYGGIPVKQMMESTPFGLEGLVGPQPLVFDAPKIQAERWPKGPTATRTSRSRAPPGRTPRRHSSVANSSRCRISNRVRPIPTSRRSSRLRTSSTAQASCLLKTCRTWLTSSRTMP
jgi:hypothetical protein